MGKEIEEFIAILRTFTNNEKLFNSETKSTSEEEVYLLLSACKQIIFDQCYRTILEKKLIKEIKIKLLKTIQDEISKIRSNQLEIVFSRKLELYEKIEIQKIEALENLYHQIETKDNHTIIDIVISQLVARPEVIEQLKKQKDTVIKQKLEGISYDKKPCIQDEQINDAIIEKICKEIINQGLKDIVLRVQVTLDNDETFKNLKAIKDNAEEIVTNYYIRILRNRIKNIEYDIRNNSLIIRISKSKKIELPEIRRIIEKKLNKKIRLFTNKEELYSLLEQIETIFKIRETIDEEQSKIAEYNELTLKQQQMFKETETYRTMQERKLEASIELSLEGFVKKIKNEIDKIAQELSNNLSEELIATEQEQQKIKEFAQRLSISVDKLVRILAGDENIYIHLITSWLMKELEKNTKTEKGAEQTIQLISADFPSKKLTSLVLRTMELPQGIIEQAHISEYKPHKLLKNNLNPKTKNHRKI